MGRQSLETKIALLIANHGLTEVQRCVKMAAELAKTPKPKAKLVPKAVALQKAHCDSAITRRTRRYAEVSGCEAWATRFCSSSIRSRRPRGWRGPLLSSSTTSGT